MQPQFKIKKSQYNFVLTKFYKKIDKPLIKISIARIFYSHWPMEESKMGRRGGHIYG
jgi:hypothetical protein